MNRKILAFAVAASLVAPMAAQADVKLSGAIQAEVNSAQVNEGWEDDADRITITKDGEGASFNGGPNNLAFDIDEKLGNGLSAFARYQVGFNTYSNSGLSNGKEAYVGLKGSAFHIKFGKMTGVYKGSKGLIDPFAGTSLQARGTGGGMSGSTYKCGAASRPVDTNRDSETYNPNGGYTDKAGAVFTETSCSEGIKGYLGKSSHGQFTHSSYVSDAIELGFGNKKQGFSATIQGVIDDSSDIDGAGLVELRYAAPNFTVFASGAFTDLSVDAVKNTALGDEAEDSFVNWKIGGQFKMAGVKLGLQYEEAEMGALEGDGVKTITDINGLKRAAQWGGAYVTGSAEYRWNNVSLAAWVSGYMSDKEDWWYTDEDALSWALGAKYNFSKRTMLFAGYRQTDSDNDYRDEDVFSAGLRHKF